MKHLKTAVLIVALLLPLVALLANDLRFNRVLDGICKERPALAYSCDYPERYERERLITTAFHRHLRTYFGGEMGTSPSFVDSMQAAMRDSSEPVYMGSWAAMGKMRQFNLYLVITMLLSFVVASIAGTLLVQALLGGCGGRHTKHKSE